MGPKQSSATLVANPSQSQSSSWASLGSRPILLRVYSRNLRRRCSAASGGQRRATNRQGRSARSTRRTTPSNPSPFIEPSTAPRGRQPPCQKTRVRVYYEIIELCTRLKDNGTREALEPILTESEERVDWLETQLGLIEAVGMTNYLTEQIGESEE